MRKNLFQLSVPIFVESMMGTIIGSIDTIMLSSYSDDAVVAVSIANQILFLIQVLACIVTTGTSILCAQYIGAEKPEDEQNDLIAASVLMNVGMGVILTILMSLFYPMILGFLNLSGTVRGYAGDYLKVINLFLWAQSEFGLCKCSPCGGGCEISILHRTCFHVGYCSRRKLFFWNCSAYGTFWNLDCRGA